MYFVIQSLEERGCRHAADMVFFLLLYNKNILKEQGISEEEAGGFKITSHQRKEKDDKKKRE